MKTKKSNKNGIMYHTFLITLIKQSMKDEVIGRSRGYYLNKPLTKKERKENKRLILDREYDDLREINL